MIKFFPPFFVFGLILFSAPSNATTGFPGNSVFHLNANWLDQNGKILQLSELEGSVLAVAMVYTSCQYSCPLIIEEMNRIKAKLPAEIMPKVKFVLISMDPQRDTPEQLKAFAAKRKLDLSLWHLYTSKSERPVREFSAIIGAKIRKAGKEFAHSNIITVIGPSGVIEFTKANIGQQIDEAANAINTQAAKLIKR